MALRKLTIEYDPKAHEGRVSDDLTPHEQLLNVLYGILEVAGRVHEEHNKTCSQGDPNTLCGMQVLTQELVDDVQKYIKKVQKTKGQV